MTNSEIQDTSFSSREILLLDLITRYQIERRELRSEIEKLKKENYYTEENKFLKYSIIEARNILNGAVR